MVLSEVVIEDRISSGLGLRQLCTLTFVSVVSVPYISATFRQPAFEI